MRIDDFSIRSIEYILFNFHNRREPNESSLVFQKMERQLRRIKNNSENKAPKTCHEVIQLFISDQIMAKYGYNLRGTDEFYVAGEATESHDFCLFASKESIKLVEENIAPPQRIYLMDATFKIVPHGRFRQLLIIHIQWNNNVRRFF